MLQILRDIFADCFLAANLGFKGGTALMFFYDLPRFSVDLDFNLLNKENEASVYERVKGILLKYGKIHDEAIKFYGPIIVLDYGMGERKLKVEISNRQYDNHYEIKNYLGIEMRVMTQTDMFSHKLCALTDRSEVANRDIFDCWFFMRNQTPINPLIIKQRMDMQLQDYIAQCITLLEQTSDSNLLNGLGELVDNKMKHFVKTQLRTELISNLRIFKEFPIIN